ncbi:MAG: GntR family transcriptional regulator [Verrucomicrobiota bacterium]
MSKAHESELIRDPVYHQLHDRLRAQLSRGDYAPGAQFLTEREISTKYRVSRVTANKALSHLVVSGALEFRKGVGTFVRAGGLQNDLRQLVSFTEKAEACGLRPTTKVLSYQMTIAGEVRPEVGEALKVEAEEALHYFERLRLADEEPVILERRFVVARFCPRLTKTQLRGSLYALLEDELGIQLGGAEQTIRALSLPAGDAKLLGVPAGTAALWVRATGFTAAGEPLWLEDTLYRADRYEFQNVLGARQQNGPARPKLGTQPEYVSFGK